MSILCSIQYPFRFFEYFSTEIKRNSVTDFFWHFDFKDGSGPVIAGTITYARIRAVLGIAVEASLYRCMFKVVIHLDLETVYTNYPWVGTPNIDYF